ncbi:carbohydrate porin [Klebsiella pneumoniae]
MDGSYNGASAIGRLGRTKATAANSNQQGLQKRAGGYLGSQRDVRPAWSDEVNLKKAYVGVTNVLESNPNAYIWAGRDFRQHPRRDQRYFSDEPRRPGRRGEDF